MTSPLLIPVILAGGKGEYFWPPGRKHRPKQFLSLDGSGKTLLQATAANLLPLAGSWHDLWIVTTQALAAGVVEQLPDVLHILAEPESRDTAAAVAWAAYELQQTYGDEAILGFFPADHLIRDPAAFQAALRAAVQLAITKEAIVTLGIKPDFASTGYGYIERGQRVGIFEQQDAYRVERFTEKPYVELAQAFLDDGNYFWNSGMFICRASVILREFAFHAPAIYHTLLRDGITAQLPKLSLDYALMEKTNKAYMIPVDFGWDDLGDWNALIAKKDRTQEIKQALCALQADRPYEASL